MSWANVIQFILNSLPFVVGGASIVLILLQYVIIGFALVNLFMLIMAYNEKQKVKKTYPPKC